MNNQFDSIKQDVRNYYTQKIISHGAVPRGVDWNSLKSQEVRFEQLLKICDRSHGFTLNDYGCGYGYLFEFMTQKNYKFQQYNGFDLSEEMISEALVRYSNYPNCYFSQQEQPTKVADYTVASGIFNVKLNYDTNLWEKYVQQTISALDSLSRSGFAFNILTKYSDAEYMRDNLYYADPCFYFDFCKRNFSRNVALLHDYDLYEFTILVRKDV